MKQARPNISLILFSFVLLTLVFTTFPFLVEGKSCSKIEDTHDRIECYEEKEEETIKKLNETKDKIEGVQNQLEKLSSQLNVTDEELDQVQVSINSIKSELEIIKSNLEDRKQKLEDKINFRNSILRTYAKRSVLSDLELFFSSKGLSGFQLSNLTYSVNKSINSRSLEVIGLLNDEISTFEENKKEAEELKFKMETTQANLVSLKNELDLKKGDAEEEHKDLEEKKEDYEEELEELQNNILILKSGDENGTVGDYEQPEVKTPDPPFKPAFAAFSYGAYTHYNGMSQYGAKGRADDGKDYEDILKFYYKSGVKKKDDFPSKISVQGYGDLDFQYYLYGLAEMPTSWPTAALKAQAIAGRTYAYRHGKPICITQACQVFSKSKADKVKDGKYPEWKKAVDDTKKKILKEDVSAQYSSTTGGYINNVGWDKNGSWPSDAYEKKAKSPWFYKAWYTKSYADNSTCDHPHPWLKEKEIADILNSWVLWKKGDSGERGHITPVSKDCWGGEPYSLDKMAEKADKYGGKYTSVSKAWVDISNGGHTSKVHFETNRGTVSIDGSDFKTVFNLRAPSYVAIRSRLFDFEYKK